MKEVKEALDVEEQRSSSRRRIIGIILWVVGVLAFVAFTLIIHMHPGPWPVETDVVKAIQGPRPVPCNYHTIQHSWVDSTADLTDRLDDPIESVALPVAWMVGMFLFRLFLQGLSLGLTVLTSSSLWGLLTIIAGRPRPTPADGVCVHRVIAALSFPSGHVMHDVAFYGFLLYLSFSEPVRRWRYHRFLLPLQILAVLYMLAIGYARLESGEHHLFDVLGAYLAAVLWLCVCIFAYEWVRRWLAERRAKKAL